MERTLEKLRGAGAALVDVDLGDFAATSVKIGPAVGYYEVKRDLSDYLARYQPQITLNDVVAGIASRDVKDIFARRVLGEEAPTEEAYRDAMEVLRPKFQKMYADAFASQRLDALILPTTVLPAQSLENSAEVMLNGQKMTSLAAYVMNTRPVNNAGIAGLSVPMGLTAEGLPLGVEVDGPAGSDRHLLAIGLELEKILGPVPPPER
jgi:mandelamide amidase